MKQMTWEERLSMYKDSLVYGGNNERLKRVLAKAQRGEEVTIAYLGASLTQGGRASQPEKCYAYLTYEYMNKTYAKNNNMVYINAGLGGTTSSYAIMRFEKDVISKGEPDLVFYEFAVNDGDDPTRGEAYESLLRMMLNRPNKPAVILVCLMFMSQYNCQERFIPVGQKCDVPVISIKNAIAPRINAGIISNEEFFDGDELHPIDLGHQLMADCINYVIDELAARPTDKPYELAKQTVYPNSFENLHMLDTMNEDLWIHNEKSKEHSYKRTFKFKNLLIAYRRSSDENAGAVQVLIDGVCVTSRISLKFDTEGVVEVLDSYKKDGWNNPWIAVVREQQQESSEHTLELKMVPGDETKNFSLIGIDYNV